MTQTTIKNAVRPTLQRFSVLVLGVCIFSLMTACVPQTVDPLTLSITERDKQESPFPPTAEELTNSPQLLLSLLTYKGDTVTDQRLNATLSFIHSVFTQQGNFSAVPMKKVDELLAKEEYQRFQAGNVADAIQLGKSLNAAFVAQMQVTIESSEVVKSIDQFVANVNLTIFTTDSGQIVFKQDVVYDTQSVEASERDLKKLVQQYLPLRAYILETRGDRQYAKISIGRSLGIRAGREFQVRNREVKNEIVAGVTRRTVSFSPLALATVKVVKVTEDESWVSISERDRNLVMKGQIVFALPEKKFILF